ncbi:MAG: hypothetical protein GX329_07125 [Tissierellia bacterium]|nr:hypothetical protein [Tissierellia bacterium]
MEMYIIFHIIYFFIYNIVQIFKSPFYWIIIGIIAYQYGKIAKWKKLALEGYGGSYLCNIFTSMMTGLLGGIMGSVMFVHLGTIIDLRDLYALIIMAILLSLIDPRYMCFAYGGGIISLISLKFGYPHIDIPQIMTVVGVLHLVESIMILIDGTRGRLPIFMDSPEGLIGGFSMNRFWPVPLVMFINKGSIYPATIMAILGYGDIALTDYPERKSILTVIMLFLFSILVIVFAQVSIMQYKFRYVVAIFAPLGHETVVAIGRWVEERGNLKFKPSDMGLKVLDTLPDSIARKMGLESGDIIVSINGNRVYHEKHLKNALDIGPSSLSIRALNREMELVSKEYRGHIYGIQDLGVVLIPDVHAYAFNSTSSRGAISELMDRFRSKGNWFRN